MEFFNSPAQKHHNQMEKEIANIGTRLLNYATDGVIKSPAIYFNETISQQRAHLLSDMYYYALEGARGIDQGAGMRQFEKIFYLIALPTVFTMKNSSLFLEAIHANERVKSLNTREIIHNPKGLRENLYSMMHDHLEKNKDKPYAKSQTAQKLLDFFKNQCPSIKRQKRMYLFCKNLYHAASKKVTIDPTSPTFNPFGL